jgi:hypothetical protein
MRFGHNSTIGLKTKKCVVCGNDCIWFSKKRCQNCSRIQDAQKRMEVATDRLIQNDDLSTIVADLDAIFSQWVRLSAARKDGYLKCFICDSRVRWQDAQNMHYIKRGTSLFLRFDPRNNKAGCKTCNELKDGNYIEYAKRLEQESPGITEILYEEGNLVTRPTKGELKQLISEYSQKVKILKNEKDSRNV